MPQDTGASVPDQALVSDGAQLHGLHPLGFDPSRWMRLNGIRREWTRDSVTSASAAMMARRYGTPFEWGEPIAAYTWTKEIWHNEWDCDATTKAVACLFANGRVCDIRFGARGRTTSFYTAPAIAMEARQGGDGETRPHPKDDSAGPLGHRP